MPPSANEPRTSWRSTTAACDGSTPWPRTAWESESAVEIASPARLRLALTAMAATTMRGRTSLMAVRVWTVSWPMTIAPPTRTNRTRKASAMPSVICHSSTDPALGGDVRGGEQGVAEQGEDRVERRGDEVAEPVVDGGLDVAGDVEQAGRGLRAAADTARRCPARASSVRWCCRGRPGCPAAPHPRTPSPDVVVVVGADGGRGRDVGGGEHDLGPWQGADLGAMSLGTVTTAGQERARRPGRRPRGAISGAAAATGSVATVGVG